VFVWYVVHVLYCCNRKPERQVCKKLHTVAASNNRAHASQSLIFACSRHVYILRAHPVRGESDINTTPTERDNTNWRAGGLCFQMKNVNFRWAGGLHKRQKTGPVGCTKRQSGGLQKRAALRPALFRRPAYCAAHWPVV